MDRFKDVYIKGCVSEIQAKGVFLPRGKAITSQSKYKKMKVYVTGRCSFHLLLRAKLACNSVSVAAGCYHPPRTKSVHPAGCEIEVLSPVFYFCLAWYVKIGDVQ